MPLRPRFQHLERPQQAFAELVRVARPGARIVVADPDWDLLFVDAADKALTRQIVTLISDRHRNGWMGRQLPALASRYGLVSVRVATVTPIFTEWTQANQLLGFERAVEEGVSAGIVSPAEAAGWVQDLKERSATGRFFSGLTGFIVSGRKP